jgi:hypothetical protein
VLFGVADNRVEQSVAFRLRSARMQLVREVLTAWIALDRNAARPLRLSDLGGTGDWWRQHAGLLAGLGRPLEVDLVNRSSEPVPERLEGLTVHSRVGDARSLPEVADGAYDLVFSNSVIEHVGVFAEQIRMAGEVARIGRNYLIQTPNRWFPIEPHFLVPFWQFLPRDLRVFLHRRFKTGWYGRAGSFLEARATVDEVRLLDRRDLAALFPDALILGERVAGLTKSLLVMGGAVARTTPEAVALPPHYRR